MKAASQHNDGITRRNLDSRSMDLRSFERRNQSGRKRRAAAGPDEKSQRTGKNCIRPFTALDEHNRPADNQ
jgi:hypothetical protein